MRWSKVRDALRPTQAALGFDWVFYKLKNFTSADAAQRYMDAKPVPYVLRGGKLFIVDHHHTLVALDLFCRSTGADPYVTLEQIRSFDQAGDSSLSAAAFWGFMEGKGWAFLRDAAYNRTPTERLPLDFVLSSFRNDVFRSMGGFARVFGLLRRGKELDDTLFFEFRWGYLFWLHRNDGFGLWPDKRLLRAFQRYVALIGEIDSEEYAEEARLSGGYGAGLVCVFVCGPTETVQRFEGGRGERDSDSVGGRARPPSAGPDPPPPPRQVAAGALNVRDAIFLSNNVRARAGSGGGVPHLFLVLASSCVLNPSDQSTPPGDRARVPEPDAVPAVAVRRLRRPQGPRQAGARPQGHLRPRRAAGQGDPVRGRGGAGGWVGD